MPYNHTIGDPFEINRITNVIFNHWNDIKGTNSFPREVDLDITYLEPFLDNCFLIKAEGVEDGRYNYKFIGKNVLNVYGSDLTRTIDMNGSNPLTQKDKIVELLIHKRPIIDEGIFFNVNEEAVRYHQCLVPLTINGYDIESIFGGMSLDIYVKKANL
jgi:hypothetical protein